MDELISRSDGGLSRSPQIDVEITPEFLNFPGLNHLIEGLCGMLVLLLLAVLAAFENLLVGHVAHDAQVFDNPLVQMKAPMGQSMC